MLLPQPESIRRRASIVLILALAARLTLFLLSGPWKDDFPQRLTYVGDPFEYAVLGRSLITRGEFSLTWPVSMPNALRVPVFPAFVAVTSGGAQLHLLWLTILCQVVIDSLFAVFLMHALDRLFQKESFGWLAGLLYACSPDAILWSTQLLAESISMWLIGGAIYGLAAVPDLVRGGARGRFCLGVVCGALLPLSKPVWQYLWALMMVWMIYQMWRARSRPVLAWLIAGTLIMAVPGVAWMKRNYDAWGLFTLSVSKPYVQRVSAEGILIWANVLKEAALPDYSYEMRMHFLVPEFNHPDPMPESYLNVTTWDHHGLAQDYRRSEELFSRVQRQYWKIYLKQHIFGTAYLLFSPGTNYVRRFIGSNELTEEAFGFIGQADLGTSSKFMVFLRRSLRQPMAVIWTGAVVVFLLAYYLAVLGGAVAYWKEYRWHVWNLFLVGGGALVFLLGPVGSSRYRFVLIQAFLPIACLGITRWRQRRTAVSPLRGADGDGTTLPCTS